MASFNAKAAAAASGPSMEKAVTLDSLDARIVQYSYGKRKLERLIASVRQLRAVKGADRRPVPLVNNILLLSGPIFNVNDLIYKRFEILNNGGVFNAAAPVQAPLNTNSVNFDLFENLTNYDTTKPQALPNAKHSHTTLALFEELCKNALAMYEEKLRQALVERNAWRLPKSDGAQPVFETSKLDDILQFPELETVGQLVYQPESEPSKKNEDEIRSVLQAIDMESIRTMTDALDASLAQLQALVKQMESCKTRTDLAKLPHWDYAVHRGLAILLRLADLYAVVRKFGRRIFFQDYHYLKVLSQYYKIITQKIANLEICFNQQKRSNLLLASITKLTRQGARQQVRPESVLALAKDAKNAYRVVGEANKYLKDLLDVWTSSSEDFAKRHGTNTTITSLREKAKNDVLKQRLQQSRQLAEDRQHIAKRLEKMYISPTKNKTDAEAQAAFLKAIEDRAKEDRLIAEAAEADMNEAESLSRSSSISLSSAGSGSGSNQLTSPSRLSRTSSLQRRSVIGTLDSPSAIPISRNGSMRTTGSTPRSNASKRHSMIIQGSEFYSTPSKTGASNSSLRSPAASISSAESLESSMSTPPVLKMSPPPPKTVNLNSTPLRRSASLQARSNAAAGAGAAFVNRRSPANDQKKSNSFQGASQTIQQRLQAANAGGVQNPPANPVKRPLTAQERLQAHILNQQKSGNMTVRQLPDKPKIVYKSFGAHSSASPTGSIDSSTAKSPSLLSVSSPSNSRASSLQSITESPVVLSKKSTVTEGDVLTDRMNRSRSNSLQNEDGPPPKEVSVTRLRSNSASKRPAVGITKIVESEPDSANTTIGDRQDGPPMIITHEEIQLETTPAKKVRFTGVPEYHASEDAPSANRALKNFRKVVFRTSSGVEITKKKERILSSQEGAAFRAFNQQGTGSNWEGFSAANQKQNQIPTMRTLAQPAAGKRLSKLFKTR